MTISKGKEAGGVKIGIYGPEGVGKSTFAAQAPGAVFIDTEGGTRMMDVARFDGIKTFTDVKNAIAWVIDHPDQLKTLVIDTVDWMERYAADSVCLEKKWKNLEDAGYGKGYQYLKQTVQGVLDELTKLVEKGVNVILVCHSMIRKFEQPDEMGAYDRYTLKLNEKNVAPIVREWLDALFFINYKTDVITGSDGKTKKAIGGQKRIMYANHTAAFDAKNRFGLPDEMPFDFQQIAHIFEDVSPVPETVEPDELDLSVEPVKPSDPPKPLATVSKTLPEEARDWTQPAKRKKKEAPAPAERPESMISEDPEKDKLLQKLWGLMQKDAVNDPLILQGVVAERDYYDLTVPVRDYDAEFISDVLIEAWEQVNKLCQTKILDLPF